MVLGLFAAVMIAFFSMFIPGILLAFALLKRTELHTFEIVVIGFIFGLIAPATLTWGESYLINYVHFFTFSATLFEINALILTIIGAVLCFYEGVFTDFLAYASGASSKMRSGATSSSLDSIRSRLRKFEKGREIISIHEQEENSLASKQRSEMSALSGSGSAEKENMDKLHRESLERLRESNMRQESLLLSELDTKPTPTERSMFKPAWWVWALLLAIMLLTFYTRMQSIVIAPKFFEFDPYFDMIDAHYILTYGHQLLLDPSAWPVVAAGTNHRLQPLVPYLEAFWYTLVNNMQFHHAAFSTSLMSYVGSVYPPITAALLVFVIFVLLYHEYDEIIGLIGAAFTATMPVLFTTFIAGEQLVEPWGIFALFFFFATYMLAIRNQKDKRLAVLAGIAFASNFLGAHYYTVTAGVLAIYIIIEGILDILRNEPLMDFYKMNAIVLVTIILFYALYAPYQATLQSNLSSLIGIPIVIAAPLFALILVAVLDIVPKELAKRKMIIKETNFLTNLAVMVAIVVILLVVILFTRLGNSVKNYINLSARFTTPSKALFMTVQEYIPTGPLYQFGGQGFGAIAVGIFGLPIIVWVLCVLSVTLIVMSIAFRRSKTGVLYIAIALPLMAAGFSEVKYLPHFGVAYILLFGITLGEMYYLASSNYYKGIKNRELALIVSLAIGVVSLLVGFSLYSFGITATFVLGFLLVGLSILLLYITRTEKPLNLNIKTIYSDHPTASQLLLIVGLFFLFGIVFLVVAVAFILIYRYGMQKSKEKGNSILIVLCLGLAAFSVLSPAMLAYGESGVILDSFSSQLTYMSNPVNACTLLSNSGNSLGYNLYCNVIQGYWLNAMAWISTNVGPSGPRVLSWWDYGDWINWFGRANAVLRGDNSVAKEDYATAAQFVLGSKFNSTPQSLASYMNGNQTRYVLFDQDLIQKWGALNFLGCVNINATSEAFAIAQGKSNNPPVPYVLGTSQCELEHDPEFLLLPLSALVRTNQTLGQQSLSNYCQISNASAVYISGYLVIGSNLVNSSVCVNATPNAQGVMKIYDTHGNKLNSVIQSASYLGVQNLSGNLYVEFLMLYLPNAPNGSITNAPSQFYDSNYYKGFVLGNLPGFKQVYPSNATGINYVNGTYPIRIYELLNYTGGLPPVPAKPSWVHNNDTMP